MELNIIDCMQMYDKSCLIYKYKWEMRREAVLRNKLTLDRTNGHEVLHFINDFFKAFTLSSITTFKRVEYLMYNHLPININKRAEITSWLLKHWDREFYI